MWFFFSLLIWIGGFGWLSRTHKHRISDWVIQHSSLPRYVNYFLLASVLIIIEELLTCQPVISTQCLPTTFPVFHIMLGVLYIAWKFTDISPQTGTWIFGLWGGYSEMILLGKQAILQQQFPDQPHLIPLFWLLVIPTYMIIASIPITYAHRQRRLKS